jgi:long-chain acyl-CoA synthetase
MLDHFLTLVRSSPEAVALIDGRSGVVDTRTALLERAEGLAARFDRAGIGEGELVAVQLPNSADFVAAFIASLMRRLVFVPIDRDALETEVAKILGHFSVRAFVYRGDDQPSLSVRGATRPSVLPGETRMLKLTSGSTGMPKGIAASEANLAADCVNICATMEIAPGDVNFGAIPMSHSYGFSNLVTPLLLQGTAAVIANDYLPESIVDLCNRHRCTVLPGIPMVFDHLAASGTGKFESVRTFLSAGAPLPPATSRRFRERFGRPIHTFYGCSECGGITYDRLGAAVERGTAGRPMENVSVTIEDDRAVIAGDNVALGYLHDSARFRPFERGRFVVDDLVEILDDGEIELTGRMSDFINTAGKKVNPREVEQVILQIAGVREAKVYGEPAGARGEVVAAAIVADPDVTREQVREFCRARLSAHKVPRIVKLIDAIPLDERGKVRRSALAAL